MEKERVSSWVDRGGMQKEVEKKVNEMKEERQQEQSAFR